jgi:branched-chain amino acid transport system ATP-binding protein
MDVAESASLGELLRHVSNEAGSILLIEHDVPLVLAVCHRIYVLDFGRLIAAGTPEAIRADERVRTAYFGSTVTAGGG